MRGRCGAPSVGCAAGFSRERPLSLSEEQTGLPDPFWRALARKDVLAGLLFIVVAVLGLWISRDYPIGTALRMGTRYVPRLLFWLLLRLCAIVLVPGPRGAHGARPLSARDVSALRPVAFVTPDPLIFRVS